VVWRRRLSAIFTLPNATSDGGWNLDRLGHYGLFVGSVGTRPRLAGGKEIIDLAHTMTAGFTVRRGRVKWRRTGFYACNMLPCHGGNEAGFTAPGAVSAPGPSVGLREVMRGNASFTPGSGSPQISQDASLTIQGFDPATGRTLWAFDAGRNTGLISGQLVPPRTDTDTIVVRDRAGRLVALNLRTGSSRRFRSSRTGWCRSTITYRLSNSVYYGGKSGQYVGQAGLYACTGNGGRISTPRRVPDLVRRIGAAAEGIVAWADTNAIHATTLG
jgi:outer membrane protein assembly factor BamB